MKRALFLCLAVCSTVVLSLLVVPAPAAASDAPPQTRSFLYLFTAERAGTAEPLHQGHIVYEVAGRSVHRQGISFRFDREGQALIPLRLPQVAWTEGALRPDLRIHVYAGETLLDSFDPRGLRAYDMRLRHSLGPEKLEALGFGGGDPDQRMDAGGMRAVTAAFSACQTSCRQAYFQCVQSCPDQQCQWYCEQDRYDCELGCPDADSDGDGTVNLSDNCLETYNPSQANCDGDAFGDACDSLNATYVTVQSEKTCMTDRDDHTLLYKTFEHHVEKLQSDVSSCGAPDRWVGRIAEDNDCFNLSDRTCCDGLDTSILSFGDDPEEWCTIKRNIDYCNYR